MLSQRIYKLFSLVLYFGKLFDVSAIRLNTSTRLLYYDESKWTQFNLYRNFVIIMVYYTGISMQIVTYYIRNDFDRINLAFSFLFGLTIFILGFTLSVFFSRDMCAMFNGLLGLLEYFHSKLLIYQKIALIYYNLCLYLLNSRNVRTSIG